jgi:Domain of unknown function (DUF4333)
MNESPQPDPGDARKSGTPWHQRRPTSDDDTSIAKPRPSPPRRYPPPTPPPVSPWPPAAQRPSPPADIPWYLERPEHPPQESPAAEYQKPTAKPKDAGSADPNKLLPWLLVGAGGLAVLIGTAVLLSKITQLGITGRTVLDVSKVQTGVLLTLSDPASGYGANTVADVSCNNGRNPSADKGTTFTCDATVNGAPRHVTVVVSDDRGTYEIDSPR